MQENVLTTELLSIPKHPQNIGPVQTSVTKQCDQTFKYNRPRR